MSDIDEELHEIASGFLDRFRAARKKARLFPLNHKYVRSAVEELLDIVRLLLREKSPLTFSINNNELYFEGDLMPEETLEYRELIDEFCESDLQSWTFEDKVTLDELVAFIAVANKKKAAVDDEGGWERVFKAQSIEHIRPNWRFALGDDDGSTGLPHEVYDAVRDATLSAFTDARERKLLNVELLEDVVGILVSTVTVSDEIIGLVNDIREADEYTLSHSVNVSILSLLIGSKLKLPPALLQSLGVAALVHDIGKTKVPDEILNKPDQLSADEWVIMQAHTLEGVKILSEQHNIDHLAIVIAAQHHARVDLKGYPTFHALSELHTLSKLVAVADSYDAITSNRSYRRALPPDVAVKILFEGLGTQFDPVMLKVFAQMAGMFPVGTCVLLDTGDLAVVTRGNPEELYRPVVKIVRGRGASPTRFPVIDLADQGTDGGPGCNIVRSVDAAEHGINVANVF